MIQITFNNKTNNDFDVVVEDISIQPPSKRKTKESVIGMNGYFDFSTVATNGEIIYDEREILIRFNLITSNRTSLYIKYTKALEWLIDTVKNPLIFDFMSDFYFMAEVETAPKFEEVLQKNGKMEVIFIAEPFKKGINLEGSDIWDTFNFEIDVAQDVEFDVSGSKTITIENVGRVVVPTVNCTSSMTVLNNGYTASFVTGDNKDWNFKLQPGTNTIQITGTGHIKFIFRKELL